MCGTPKDSHVLSRGAKQKKPKSQNQEVDLVLVDLEHPRSPPTLVLASAIQNGLNDHGVPMHRSVAILGATNHPFTVLALGTIGTHKGHANFGAAHSDGATDQWSCGGSSWDFLFYETLHGYLFSTHISYHIISLHHTICIPGPMDVVKNCRFHGSRYSPGSNGWIHLTY
jgi:hypothetical protein